MSEDTPAPSFEDRVHSIVNGMEKTDDGKWQMPKDEELSEAERFAAMAERRRRDTESTYTKAQQQLRAVQAENSKLTEAWAKDVSTLLTTEQRDELEELKATDPDAWRDKLNDYETQNAASFTERKDDIVKAAHKETELEMRTRLLEEHNGSNPDLQITDDVIANDVPPRFVKQLENGTVSFEQFLANVAQYLGTPKVMTPGTPVPDGSKLGKAAGGSQPSQSAVAKELVNSYKGETY